MSLTNLSKLLGVQFGDDNVTIEDQSDEHIGHAESNKGGHFSITIVSDLFNGLNILERHRLIYSTVGDLESIKIHALTINAHSLEEANKTKKPK